jgi:hypothetical protein
VGSKLNRFWIPKACLYPKINKEQARGPPIKDRNVVKSTNMLHVQKSSVSGDPIIRRGVVLLIVE